MCGRYSITTLAEALWRLFQFTGPLANRLHDASPLDFLGRCERPTIPRRGELTQHPI